MMRRSWNFQIATVHHMKKVELMLDDLVAEALEKYQQENSDERALERAIGRVLWANGFLEKRPLPRSVGMGHSGVPDLAQRDEELLWAEDSEFGL
jgi:hypothetical protein